jgi:hypothetical protein
MSAEIDDLLGRASTDPASVDAEALWHRGRRRRWARRAGAVGGTVAVVVAIALVAPTVGGPTAPEIAPLGPGEGAGTPAAEQGEAGEDARAEDERAVQEAQAAVREQARAEARARSQETLARLAQEQQERERQAQERAEQAQRAAEEERQAVEEAAAAAASEDAMRARLADPCAPHRGRDHEAFLDLVAPVEGEAVGADVELVGCSNVYEATVNYRFVRDGRVVGEGFTTATCGSGCVGEFRERVAVPAGGPVVLEVFWPDAADGTDRDLVRVTLERR